MAKAQISARTTRRGLKVYLKYLPKELQKEYEYRQQYDPHFIEQQLGLQHKYDPQLATEQRAALERRDPQWLAMHEAFGDKVKQALEQGYVDPQRAAFVYRSWEAGTWRHVARGDTMTAGRAPPDDAGIDGPVTQPELRGSAGHGGGGGSGSSWCKP